MKLYTMKGRAERNLEDSSTFCVKVPGRCGRQRKCAQAAKCVDEGSGWRINIDNEGHSTMQAEAKSTRLWLDIVVWPQQCKIAAMIELRIPLEARVKESQERKRAKETELKGECED